MQDDRLDAAFDAWVQAQTAALDVVRQATGVPETDVDLAEGYRWVTRLTRLALDWIVEKSDPLHPQLFVLQDEYKKLLVDNPDVHYTVLRARRLALLPARRVPGRVRLPRHDLRHAVRAGPGRGPHGDADPDPHRRVRARPQRRGRHPDRAGVGHARPAGRATPSCSSPARRSWPSARPTSRSSPSASPACASSWCPSRARSVPPPILSTEELAPKLEFAAMFLTFVGGTALQMWHDAGRQHEHVRRPGRLGARGRRRRTRCAPTPTRR